MSASLWSVFNFLEQIKSDPGYHRQLRFDDQLVTEYKCPLDQPRQDMWSPQNYFVYVLNGRKGWHSAEGEVLLSPGECAFVRKGATIVDQYLEHPFCVVMFFLTDVFICDTLRPLGLEKRPRSALPPSVLRLNATPVLQGFFHGMLPHFDEPARPELLQLKFKELLLTTAADPQNAGWLAYCCSLLNAPEEERLRLVMEDNYCFNLSLEEFAELSGRSLSSFKRDFQDLFAQPPGQWIRSKRLERARSVLLLGHLQVSEVAFACGFENLSHFSRAFKEHYGMSPAAMRQASQA